MNHDMHRVSCKIALYNPERTKVLVTRYRLNDKTFGLPGGHLDRGEIPDETIIREIKEEIGIDYSGPLKKVGFDIVNVNIGEKVCLEYIGELSESAQFEFAEGDEVVDAHWASLEDIRKDRIDLRDYKQFVLDNA